MSFREVPNCPLTYGFQLVLHVRPFIAADKKNPPPIDPGTGVKAHSRGTHPASRRFSEHSLPVSAGPTDGLPGCDGATVPPSAREGILPLATDGARSQRRPFL